MIIFLTENPNLEGLIKKEFEQFGIPHKFLSFQNKSYTKFLSTDQNEIIGIVTDEVNPHFSKGEWLELLENLGKHKQVVVLTDDHRNHSFVLKGMNHHIVFSHFPNAKDLISIFDINGQLGLSQRMLNKESIPFYNPNISLHMLKQNGSLSMLSIHSTDFRKVAIEYGADAYKRLQLCMQNMLYELWGTKGSFRARDILCQTSPHSNTYYILLEQGRSEKGIPSPSTLEKLADRIAIKLQSLFWRELLKPKKQRLLPGYLHVIPEFSVGYATKLYNPCVDSNELVDELIVSSHELAKVQHQRIHNRKQELMQTLIRNNHLLIPYFQGVFNLQKLKDEDVLESIKTGSIKPIKDQIYSFESLIRVNARKVDKVLHDSSPIYLEARYLRPDVLFDLAQQCHLSLELDQACLKYAAQGFSNLPGKIMVNILPRNFYYIEQLRHMIPDGMEVIFEVSESEAINNFDLLLNAKEKLNMSSKNFGIAIDDFGKGFAGLDRIIKIKPDLIKLDRSLISDIDNDNPKRAFVTGLVNASRNTNSVVLAEGVERMEELVVLRELGIDLIQGFLLHKPQARKDIEDQLSADSSEQTDDLDTVA